MKGLKGIFTLLLASWSFGAIAQNNAPVLSNVQAFADTVLHKLTVSYDVSDNENDSLEVFLSVSSDLGVTFPYITSNAVSDIGYPVIPGAGKHIYWDYPDSLSYRLSDLAVKITATDHFGYDIQQIVDQVDTNRLKQNLQFIEGIRHRSTGNIHLQETRDSLSAIFNRYGLQTRVHSFQYLGNYTGKNIIGRKPGEGNVTRTYIVDGHYDTVSSSPGADDNGSSIAGMLEIIRIISGLPLGNSVEFIGFDLEEAGLSGSKAFVADGILSEEDIAGVINTDMIGYYTETPYSQTVPAGFELVFPDLYARLVADSFRGNFIISTANTNSRHLMVLFDTMATRYVPELLVGSIQVPGNGELIQDSRRSDHAAFWDSGYYALHISDGAETRNPNYHSPNDISSTVNYRFMSNITKAVLATLLELARPLHAHARQVNVTARAYSEVLELENEGCRLIVSPNPSNGNLRVTTVDCGEKQVQLKIFSSEGKLIWQSSDSEQEINIMLGNTQLSGFYIIEMTTPVKSVYKKIWVR